ncbi:MAG: drug/metabolite exporter YedA, partial [Myxococcales bacterium]
FPASAPASAWAAFAYLVVFGSLVGFSAYSYLLRTARPAVAMSYAYVNPAAAVLLGAALAGETLGPLTLGSMLLVVAGVAVLLLPAGRR